MQDCVERAGHIDMARYIVLRKIEPGILKQVGDIGTRPGDEVVDAKHIPTLLNK
jgi:hypothetical protein